jgi:alkaline phosphatase D
MPVENVEVTWRVATDAAMRKVIRCGCAVASPGLGHSVHVEVNCLQPDRWYWYQFQAAGEASPIGRTRTFPPPESTPSKLKFAFASCQHYETGHFTAYRHMAREELDLVIHLGDYIYESASQDERVRKHVGPELNSLEEYRNRYAQYKTDTHLQATHAAFPWLLTWDDHEFDNNYASHISEEPNVLVEEFLRRRARAYQAFYEHMPLRRSSFPQGPDMRLYRRVPFGRLIEFDVLDTRQYRTDQPCGDHNQPPCEGVFDHQATLLGPAQEQWLTKTLSRSQATWNCLAQQVMMARVDRQPGDEVKWSMDQWAGYDVARKRLLRFLREHKIANPVVLTGDIHSNWVNDLKVDFDDPDSPTLATEFVGTSISSGGDGSQTRNDTAGVLADNPFVRFYNAERGYVACEVSEKEWHSNYRVVEYVSQPGAPLITRASFVVEKDRPGALQG